MASKIITTFIQQLTRFDAAGNAVPTLHVEYTIGVQGPFVLELSKVEATKAKIQELQEKDRELIDGLAESGG